MGAPTMVRVHPPFQVRMEDAPLATVFPFSAVVNFLMLFASTMTHPLSIRPMSATRMVYFRPRPALTSVTAYGVPPNPLLPSVRSASGFVTPSASLLWQGKQKAGVRLCRGIWDDLKTFRIVKVIL